MSDDKFLVAPVVDDAEWDRVVAEAAQGTLFAETLYLNAVARPVDRRFVMKGREVKAALLTVPSADGTRCELEDLIIYAGLMFVPEAKRPPVKRRYEEFGVTECVIPDLEARYPGGVEIALSPAFSDLRPFLWHRYHEAGRAGKFETDLRYTSLVDLSSIDPDRPEESDAFAAMETVRRYSVREAARKGGTSRITHDADALIGFYRALMARQGEAQSEMKLQQMERVLAAVSAAGRGFICEALDASGRVIYAAAFAWDAKRAYYLFGAGHPEVNEPWQGTLAIWDGFVELARRGVRVVDLEGVNSPKRGWFKLGFGGELTPYFHIRTCR